MVLSDTLAPAAFDGQQMQAACREKPTQMPAIAHKKTDRSRRSFSTASATTISLSPLRAGYRDLSESRKPNRLGNRKDSGEKPISVALANELMQTACHADGRRPAQGFGLGAKKNRSRPLKTTQGGVAEIGIYESSQPPFCVHSTAIGNSLVIQKNAAGGVSTKDASRSAPPEGIGRSHGPVR